MMSYYDDRRSYDVDGWMEVRIGGLVGALPVRCVPMGRAGPHFAWSQDAVIVCGVCDPFYYEIDGCSLLPSTVRWVRGLRENGHCGYEGCCSCRKRRAETKEEGGNQRQAKLKFIPSCAQHEVSTFIQRTL